MFAARWCGDLPELLLARIILEDKFGSDFAAAAKEGTGIVDPMVSTWSYTLTHNDLALEKMDCRNWHVDLLCFLQLVWKLSGDRTNMELKKKGTKEISTENNILVDFLELQEAVKQDGNRNGSHC